MNWKDLTSKQFSAVDRGTPVVLNVGAIEQHGAHLPLSTDAIIGQHFTDRMSQEMQRDVLILPQMAICCSSHHMDFAGTLTVSHESFLSYASDILGSVVAHGFYNIVIFNSHGGNLAIGQVLLEKMGMLHRQANFSMLTWWKVAADEIAELQESDFGGVGHACEFETSLLEYFAPHLVNKSEIKDQQPVSIFSWADGDLLVGSKASLYRTMSELTAGSGVFGKPSLASAEKGERLSNIVTEKLISILGNIALMVKHHEI